MSTAPYIVSITVDAVIAALGSFLTPFCPSTPIVRGQQNRVPPPPGAFVKLTEIMQVDIETPTVGAVASAQVSVLSPKRIDVQIDFYGPSAGDQCAAVKGIYRTFYAVAMFPAGIAPLYCSDGHQAPLTTGEEQYLQRWTITASLQYNPALYIPQQSATALGPVIINDLL